MVSEHTVATGDAWGGLGTARGLGAQVGHAGSGMHAVMPPGAPCELWQLAPSPGPVGGDLVSLVGGYQPQGSLEGGAAVDVGWVQPEQDRNSPTAPPGGAAGT